MFDVPLQICLLGETFFRSWNLAILGQSPLGTWVTREFKAVWGIPGSVALI